MSTAAKHRTRGRTVLWSFGLAAAVGLGACSSTTTATGPASTAGGGAPTTAATGTPTTAATGSPVADASTTFVGPVDGTEALVAVKVDGDQALVYYCDSAKQWGVLEGTVSGSTVTATEPGGNSFSGTIAGDALTGSLTISGTAHTVDATKATGEAGIYAKEAAAGDTTAYSVWIRDASGAVEGATFTLDNKKLADLGSLLTAGKRFTAQEVATINQIVDTGVVPSPPAGTGIPADAVAFKSGPVRCGLAGFRLKRALNAWNATDGTTPEGEAAEIAYNEAIKGFNAACGTSFGGTMAT